MEKVESSSKRQKSDSFSLTFECTSSLRTMVSVISELLQRADFEVTMDENDGKKGYLSVESVDPKQVCLVLARLSCSLKGHNGSPRFFVSTSDLMTTLKSIPHHYQLDISSTDVSNLYLFAADPICKSHEMSFKLNTLMQDEDPFNGKMNDMDYDFTLEVDTHTLRRFVRTTKELHGEDVLFKIEQPKKGGEGKKHTMLTLEAQGTTVELKETFHSIIDDTRKDGSTVICTDHEERRDELEGGGEGGGEGVVEKEVIYKDSFGASYISSYLKHLDKHTLTIRLSEGKPLVLSFPLGSDHTKNYICLVLAPKV